MLSKRLNVWYTKEAEHPARWLFGYSKSMADRELFFLLMRDIQGTCTLQHRDFFGIARQKTPFTYTIIQESASKYLFSFSYPLDIVLDASTRLYLVLWGAFHRVLEQLPRSLLQKSKISTSASTYSVERSNGYLYVVVNKDLNQVLEQTPSHFLAPSFRTESLQTVNSIQIALLMILKGKMVFPWEIFPDFCFKNATKGFCVMNPTCKVQEIEMYSLRTRDCPSFLIHTIVIASSRLSSLFLRGSLKEKETQHVRLFCYLL